MRRRGARYPDEGHGSWNDENYYASEYDEPYYVDDGYRSYPYDAAPLRRSSLPVRAARAISGVVCGAVLVLTAVVCGAQYLAGDRGFPGPGTTAVAAHVVASLVAVIAQVTADRRSGGAALLSSAVVIFTASILLLTQWWG
ncbi:hypothetical protein [Rhodococcus gordoniae]|uniref:hypothetical protein n=1 Tax=Rhodococcus gordoniae TaxID=223392 RepID=UPI0020CD843C|nr:hypothetical protein [Rhodococcus gordoniae]UTT49760.1 hypothetical protein NMQ04_06070 [Rhodococcus gordoniae]